MLRFLGAASADPVSSETALGDWYVNRVVVDRQPLLILVSSTSLLSILTPARMVRSMPGRLADLVAGRLNRLGVANSVVEPEIQKMTDYAIARTESRSVVGTMLEFGRNLPYYLPEDGWDESDLIYAEDQLANTPSSLPGPKKKYVFPCDLAQRLLIEKWNPRLNR